MVKQSSIVWAIIQYEPNMMELQRNSNELREFFIWGSIIFGSYCIEWAIDQLYNRVDLSAVSSHGSSYLFLCAWAFIRFLLNFWSVLYRYIFWNHNRDLYETFYKLVISTTYVVFIWFTHNVQFLLQVSSTVLSDQFEKNSRNFRFLGNRVFWNSWFFRKSHVLENGKISRNFRFLGLPILSKLEYVYSENEVHFLLNSCS